MTPRILPYAEYHRLADTELPALLPHVTKDRIVIVVLEQDDAIIAAGAFAWLPHFEGAWVAPAYRKRRSVFARLVDALFGAAREQGASWAMAGSASAEMTRLLTKHLAATPLPMGLFIVSTEQPCRHS